LVDPPNGSERLLQVIERGDVFVARYFAQQREHAVQDSTIIDGRDNDARCSADARCPEPECIGLEGLRWLEAGSEGPDIFQGSEEERIFGIRGGFEGSDKHLLQTAGQFLPSCFQDQRIAEEQNSGGKVLVLLRGLGIQGRIAEPGFCPGLR